MDVLSLRGVLTLDKSEYDKGLTDADTDASSFGGKFNDKMKKLSKVGIAALGASATAIGMLGKKSIEAYADTEQLVGGVQKLYGNMGMSVTEYAKTVGKSVDQVNADWQRNEKAQSIVLENAKNAFKTAGMSYNDYMEQATSFSAALINSLNGDTVAAAKQTDVAMRAISDNYNTFGGDMQNIQYAFQGFAKQNWTMLDNLKLGYGGTRSEMERLIADANKWAEENGKAADLSIDSFSDVVTAIDYIQQKQNIAGTTAREASSTIAGSIGMVKAAYDNLLAGLADPDADIGELVTNLITSVTTAGKNLVPAAKQFVKGFGTAIIEAAPQIIKGAEELLGSLIKGLQNMAPKVQPAITKIIKSIAQFLAQNAPQLLTTALTLMSTLAQGLIKAIPTLIASIPTLIKGLADAFTNYDWTETGKSIIVALGKGISSAAGVLKSVLTAPIRGARDVISNGFRAAKDKAVSWMNNLKSSVTSKITAAKDAVKRIVDKIKGFFPLKIGKIFSNLKIPKINIKGGKAPFGIGGLGTKPSISVSWNKKAENVPYLFTNATLFGAGEGVQDEIMYGKGSLMKDITEAVDNSNSNGVQIINYITVSGAENPEDFAERFSRRLKLDMRTA